MLLIDSGDNEKLEVKKRKKMKEEGELTDPIPKKKGEFVNELLHEM